ELWDYLDGELPVERAALIADNLAECARCYPQYRFEYAFLAAVARQRARGPRAAGVPPQAAAGPRRPAPRAAPPLRPRGPARGPGAAAERWALALLRLSLGVFLLFWGIAKLSLPAGATGATGAALVTGAATLEVVLAACILVGVGRRWSYGAALGVHVASLALLWGQLRDPWGVALAGLPVCGALVTLYLLRDRDRWT